MSTFRNKNVNATLSLKKIQMSSTSLHWIFIATQHLSSSLLTRRHRNPVTWTRPPKTLRKASDNKMQFALLHSSLSSHAEHTLTHTTITYTLIWPLWVKQIFSNFLSLTWPLSVSCRLAADDGRDDGRLASIFLCLFEFILLRPPVSLGPRSVPDIKHIDIEQKTLFFGFTTWRRSTVFVIRFCIDWTFFVRLLSSDLSRTYVLSSGRSPGYWIVCLLSVGSHPRDVQSLQL